MKTDDEKKRRLEILNSIFIEDYENHREKTRRVNELVDILKNKYGITISDRTLKSDIDALRQKDAPLPPTNNKSGYYYSKSFVLSSELGKAARQTMQNAIEIIRNMGLEELAAYFTDFISDEVSNRYDDDMLLVENTPNYLGKVHIFKLYEAIRKKQVLKITYQPFEEPEKIEEVHPYLLKQYNNRWFLLGFCKEANKIYNYALDRIIDFETRNSIHFIHRSQKQFKIDDYKDLIGVTKVPGAQKEKIKLKFQYSRAHYVKTKPMHISQKEIFDDKKTLVIELSLYKNNELISKILEYGKDVEVLEPLSLREEIAAILEQALRQYQS